MTTRYGTTTAGPRSTFPWLLRLTGLLFGALMLIPLGVMVMRLLFPDWQFNTDAVRDVWNMSGLWSMLRNTIIVIAVSGALAAIIGSVFAWLNERTDARLGWITEILPVMPLFIPSLAMAIGWMLLASPEPGLLNAALRAAMDAIGVHPGNSGPLNIISWPGLIFLYTLTLVPQVYLTVSGAFRNLDPALEEASRSCGAGVFSTLRRVTLPSVRPAIFSGALLAVVAGFALFAVPVAIGTPAHIDVLSVTIVRMVTNAYPPKLAEALVLAVIMVVLIGASWMINRHVAMSARHAVIGGRASAYSRVRLGVWKWPARAVMIVYLAATAVAPLVALVIVSLQSYWTPRIEFSKLSLANYREVFRPGSVTSAALSNSLRLAIASAFLAMIVASLLSYYSATRRRTVMGRLFDACPKIPATLSHIVMAIGLIAALSGPPLNLHGTAALLVIGYLLVHMPQASISAGAAMEQIGTPLLEASYTSGAREGRTFTRVVAPLMRPGFLSGWVLVFVLSAGDLTASVMLAGADTPVVGFVMLDLTDNGTYGSLTALAVVITLIMSTVSVFVLLLGRRRGRSARRRPGLPSLRSRVRGLTETSG